MPRLLFFSSAKTPALAQRANHATKMISSLRARPSHM
jgi:hypothetical protein